MAQCPPKYAPGAMSLVNDQITTVVEGLLRVCTTQARLIINGRIWKTSLALFQAVFRFIVVVVVVKFIFRA